MVADPQPVARPPRLAKLPPSELDEEQRGLYASITGGPRASGPQAFALTDETGALEGPFNAMLLSPRVGAALQAMGSSVRYCSALTDRAREIAILAVAHHWSSEFERHAHEAVGRTVGLSDDELAALARADPDAFPDPRERVVIDTCLALLSRADLSDLEYTTAVQTLGRPVLFELTTLVGYYATLALQLRVFRVGEPC